MYSPTSACFAVMITLATPGERQLMRHQHAEQKGTHTTHKEVVLCCVLQAVLDSDLHKDDVEKLGRERLYVHRWKPTKIDDEDKAMGGKAYMGVIVTPVHIDKMRSSATAVYVYTTTSCNSRQFSSSGNTKTSCSFVSCRRR